MENIIILLVVRNINFNNNNNSNNNTEYKRSDKEDTENDTNDSWPSKTEALDTLQDIRRYPHQQNTTTNLRYRTHYLHRNYLLQNRYARINKQVASKR